MCSTSNRRWESLLDLAGMLGREDVNLNELAKQIKNQKSEKTVLDPRIAALHHKSLKIKSGEVINSTSIQHSVSCRRTRRSREAEEQISEKRRRILHDHHHLLLDQHGKITASWRKPIRKFTVKRNSRKVLNRIQDSVSCKPKKKKKAPETEAEPILSEEMKKRILDLGGCEQSLCFVIKKPLFQSDVDAQQCRLSIPHGKINNKFFNKLDKTEAGRLESEAEGIPVILFGYGGEEYEMSLRNWKSNSVYALVEHWKDVCCCDKLKVGQEVEVWCFRKNSHLCFALL